MVLYFHTIKLLYYEEVGSDDNSYDSNTTRQYPDADVMKQCYTTLMLTVITS